MGSNNDFLYLTKRVSELQQDIQAQTLMENIGKSVPTRVVTERNVFSKSNINCYDCSKVLAVNKDTITEYTTIPALIICPDCGAQNSANGGWWVDPKYSKRENPTHKIYTMEMPTKTIRY